MIIQNNLLSVYTSGQLRLNANKQNNSIIKLSSGYRINRAADDAAGLSISEKMRGQIRGLNRASDNIQDGISLIQTADGALNEIQSVIQRIRELSVQASNDTNMSIDRDATQKEIDDLVNEITSISENTEFNTQKLLNGDLKDSTPTSSIVHLNSSNIHPQTTKQAIDSIGSDKVGLVFTDDSDYVTTQTKIGTGTSSAYGSYIKEVLQTEIVPQAVQSILNTFSGALNFLSGSSIGIGLNLYSENSSTLASLSCSYSKAIDTDLAFTLSVNMNSLSFNSGILTDESRQDLEATISHEMVHGFMDEALTAGMIGYNGKKDVISYPAWFCEGMAQTAGGGANWVESLGISPSSTNSIIKSTLSTLTSGTNASKYGVGYLACMYLGYMASGGNGTVNAVTISDGLNKIMQSLVSGKSLDQTIADYTKYTGLSDFTSYLQNDSDAYTFIRNLMSSIGNGRGSVISGNLAQKDLLSNTSITNLTLFKLDTTNTMIRNSYPDDVYVFSGGSATEAGTKVIPEAPDAPTVSGAGDTTSSLINLSDLSSVDFTKISGIQYNQATNTITITDDGTYTLTGTNSDTSIVVNSGVAARINASNIACKQIIYNNGSSLTTSGKINLADRITGLGSLINNGVITGNVEGNEIYNNGYIYGAVKSTGDINNNGKIYLRNEDKVECGNGKLIRNWGVIWPPNIIGHVNHYVHRYSVDFNAPASSIKIGDKLKNLPMGSIFIYNCNGSSFSMGGTWTVKDKNGALVTDPAAITMNEGDSYTYTITFDGSSQNIYFDKDTLLSLVSNREVQMPDGGIISSSGHQLSYSFVVKAGTSHGGVSHGGLNLQIGANTEQSIKIYIDGVSSSDLGIDSIQVDTSTHAQNSITACEGANKKVSELRSRLGAYQNRLEFALSNSDNMSENLQNSESRIRDLDMTDEMVRYSENNILFLVNQSILSQSNQNLNSVISLINSV